MKAMFLVMIAAACTATADDITLTDGRVLHDAIVVGFGGASVTVQSAEGTEEVPVDLLPTTLRAKYAPAQRSSNVFPATGAQVVMQLAGDGTSKSAPFRVSGRWRVRWTATAKQPHVLGPAILVSVLGADGVGVFAHSSTERMGTGETWGTGTGQVQLTVAGMECTWTVFVEQF